MSRREILELFGVGLLMSGVTSCRSDGARLSALPGSDALYTWSVNALATAIRDGAVSSEEVVTTFLDRIDETNGAHVNEALQ